MSDDFHAAVKRLHAALQSHNILSSDRYSIATPSLFTVRSDRTLYLSSVIEDYFDQDDFDLVDRIHRKDIQWYMVRLLSNLDAVPVPLDKLVMADSLRGALSCVDDWLWIDESNAIEAGGTRHALFATRPSKNDKIVKDEVDDRIWTFFRSDKPVVRIEPVTFTDAPRNRAAKALKGILRFNDEARLVSRLRKIPGLEDIHVEHPQANSSLSSPRNAMIPMVENLPVFMRLMLKEAFGQDVTQSTAASIVAGMFGFKNWETLKAMAAGRESPTHPGSIWTDNHWRYYRDCPCAVGAFAALINNDPRRKELEVRYFGLNERYGFIEIEAVSRLDGQLRHGCYAPIVTSTPRSQINPQGGLMEQELERLDAPA